METIRSGLVMWMLLNLGAVYVVMVDSNTIEPQARALVNTCPAGMQLNEAQTKCDAYVKIAKNWDDAKAHCESMDGHLVEIHSAAKQQYVEQRAEEGGTWIGARREPPTGSDHDIYWQAPRQRVSDGYTNYRDGQPDKRTNLLTVPDCLIMYPNPGNLYQWYDTSCFKESFFMCEADPIPPVSDQPSLPDAMVTDVERQLLGDYGEAVTLSDSTPIGRSQCTAPCGIGYMWLIYTSSFTLHGNEITITIYWRTQCCYGPCTANGGNGPPPPIFCRDLMAGDTTGFTPNVDDPVIYYEITINP